MQEAKHLVIAAAGTGGHVMPGLAVAAEMRARGWRVSWIGTTTGMEAGLVTKHGIDFHALDFQGVRGKGLFGAVTGGLKLLKAAWNAKTLMKRLKADAVFSTGGYIAVPVGWAAKELGRKLVLMNCDADLLMSTRAILKFADALACGFAGGARSFAGPKGHTTGNPVRAEIVALPAPEVRFADRTGPLRVFVFGGSLGAKVLNDTLPEALALLPEASRPVVLHQTGRGRDADVAAHYERLGVKATVVPFIDDMAHEYLESDLVICRAGATSVSELCAAGAAALLVPFVAKTTAHQAGNAKFMVSHDAAMLMEQSACTPASLAELLGSMTRERALEIARNARALAKPDAAREVADLIESNERG